MKKLIIFLAVGVVNLMAYSGFATTYTVGSPGSGAHYTNLRDAIAVAQPGDVVGVFRGTTLVDGSTASTQYSNFKLTIDKPITIKVIDNGNATGPTTIEKSYDFGYYFDLQPFAGATSLKLTIEGFTFVNPSNYAIGGIYSASGVNYDIEVVNCVFKDLYNGSGAAIKILAPASERTHSIVNNIFENGAPANYTNGGAIYARTSAAPGVTSYLNIVGNVFRGNNATDFGADIDINTNYTPGGFSKITVEHNKFTRSASVVGSLSNSGTGRSVYIEDIDTLVFEQNLVYDYAYNGGLFFAEMRDYALAKVDIAHNTVDKNAAVQAYASLTNVVFDVTIGNNAGPGLTIANNIIQRPANASSNYMGIRINGASNMAYVKNNNVDFGGSVPNQVLSNNFNQAPNYINPNPFPSYDFHLAYNSVDVDQAATLTSPVLFDFDGGKRGEALTPQESNDVGCFEFRDEGSAYPLLAQPGNIVPISFGAMPFRVTANVGDVVFYVLGTPAQTAVPTPYGLADKVDIFSPFETFNGGVANASGYVDLNLNLLVKGDYAIQPLVVSTTGNITLGDGFIFHVTN